MQIPKLLRQLRFSKLASSFETTLSSMKLPTQIIPAGTSLYRFIDPKYILNYYQVFSQLPPGAGRGADSSDNRWSGRKSDGLTPGVSGAYWGSTHGISAETFFYSCIKDYDPSVGPLRLLPQMTPLLINGVQSRLPYCAERDAPAELPFSGNYSMNIVIAKLIRNIETVDMDVTSDRFKDWADAVTKLLRAELDDLEFTNIAAAIEDPEFREIPRLIGNLAYAKGHEALGSKSARRDGYNVPAYDPTNANNFVFFGKDQEPLTDKLVGRGVIEVRLNTDVNAPSPGAKATIKPMSVYPDPPNSSLLVIGNTKSLGLLSTSTEPTHE